MSAPRAPWVAVALRYAFRATASANAFSRGLTRGLHDRFDREHRAAVRIARALVPRARGRVWTRRLARSLSRTDADMRADLATMSRAGTPPQSLFLSYDDFADATYGMIAPEWARVELTSFYKPRRPRVRARTRASPNAWVDATYMLPFGPTLKVRARRTVAALVR